MANRKKRLAREEMQLCKELQIQTVLLSKKKQVKDQAESNALLVRYLTSWFKNSGRFLNKALGRELENRYSSDLMLDIRRLYNTNVRSDNRRLFLVLVQHAKLSHCGIMFFSQLAQLLMKVDACRKLAGWKIPKSRDELIIYRSLFMHLFVRYELPKCVLVEIKLMPGLIDLDGMISFGKGKGIHEIGWLDFKMNGKVNFFFKRAPHRFNFIQAIWWAKIKSMLVSDLVAHCIIGQTGINQYSSWSQLQEDFVFFVRKYEIDSFEFLKEIYNFLLYQNGVKKYTIKLDEEVSIDVPVLYPGFLLLGRPVASIRRVMEEWEKLIAIYKENGKTTIFPVPAIKEFNTKMGATTLTIKRLKGIKDLADEGRIMKHCVYTDYVEKCISGDSYIYSVKLSKKGMATKRVATVEVVDLEYKLTIDEFSGKSNIVPSQIVIEKVREWAIREEICYSENDFLRTEND